MASEQVDNASTKVELEATSDQISNDVVFIDLPAPLGWTKKFTPKEGGTPQRNEIVFISPTGKEIKNKRQLAQYLKAHPNEPSAAKFDWGSGDTPRRSSRLISIPKATDPSESGSWRKKQKRSSSKKVGEKKEETNEEGGSAEDEAPTDKAEANKDEEIQPDDDKPELGNSEEEIVDVVLPGDNNTEEEHTRENKMEPEKEPSNVQAAPLYSEDGVKEVVPETAGMEIDVPVVSQAGLDKKVGSEEVVPDSNGIEKNQEVGDQTENKPVNSDNKTAETSAAAPPISC